MNSVKKAGFAFLLGALVFAGAASCVKTNTDAAASGPEELVMCYLPNEASEELAEYRSALQGELSAALGITVTEINAADYNAVVEAMRTKHADIVYYGPVSYVQAAERAGAEAMVTPAVFGDKSRAGYTSKIIVKAGSSIKTLEDLRDKTFAFVDPASTSGNYVPTLELMNTFSGMTNEDFHTNGKFFSSVTFSGKHQNGLQGVINGDIDAAPIASDILAAEIAAGRARESDFVVIHESPKIPSSPIAIRSDLPQDLKEKVKRFLLGYKDPSYFQYMLGLSPEQKPEFVEAFDGDYDYVRDLMAKVIPQ
ncbi:MAG: phosphate/phosphite/phosphonate ABC transporter substrate-binding protein [Treponema sp.]|jgi:phosphonate transport system substrate-binding protein|nr:phosphate/phosphite/phosphonate ABC transporter substrate-binding protein [Treponema sp.]